MSQHVCVSLFICTCVCALMYVCMCVYVTMYVCMYMSAYVCLCVVHTCIKLIEINYILLIEVEAGGMD